METDLDDDLTPLPHALPQVGDLPLEVFSLKLALARQAQVINELRRERTATTAGFRAVWLALLAVSVTIALAAAGALMQMGAYMERIDQVSASQQRVEQRVNAMARGMREE